MKILVLSFVLFVLTGCNGQKKEQPIWQDVKIGDLAPRYTDRPFDNQRIQTINFAVHFFEIPVENLEKLDKLWNILHTEQLKFAHQNAFKANFFSAGYGKLPIANKMLHILNQAKALRVESVSLLMLDGQTNNLTIVPVPEEQSVFYVSDDGSLQGSTVGPGEIALRIKVEKDPAARGVCSVFLKPVFTKGGPPTSIPQLAARQREKELHFTCAEFKLKMSPTDFLFIGPQKYLSDQMSLGGLFFTNPVGRLYIDTLEQKPTVRTMLIVCSKINE